MSSRVESSRIVSSRVEYSRVSVTVQWQAQYLVKFKWHFSWQAQYLAKV